MTDSRQAALDKVTVELGGERFWLGNIAQPTLDELLDVQVFSKPAFYEHVLRIVHYSLRFANEGIGNDEFSVHRLAAKVCKLSVPECIAVVCRIADFSERTNAWLEGMTTQ